MTIHDDSVQNGLQPAYVLRSGWLQLGLGLRLTLAFITGAIVAGAHVVHSHHHHSHHALPGVCIVGGLGLRGMLLNPWSTLLGVGGRAGGNVLRVVSIGGWGGKLLLQ